MKQQRTLVLEPKMKYEIKPLCTSHQFSLVLQGPKRTDFLGGFEVSFKLSEDVSVSQYFGRLHVVGGDILIGVHTLSQLQGLTKLLAFSSTNVRNVSHAATKFGKH